MGVKDLLKLFRAEGFGHEADLAELLVGERLVVDVSTLLHRFKLGYVDDLLARKFENFVSAVLKIILGIRMLGCTPIIIFDGALPPAKEAENQDRHGGRQAILDRITRGEDVSNDDRLEAVNVHDPELRTMLFNALRENAVPYIVSTHEADPELASFCREKLAKWALMRDSDGLALGIRNFINEKKIDDFATPRCEYFTIRDDLPKYTGSDKFLLALKACNADDTKVNALMALYAAGVGCDYFSVYGAGHATVAQILQQMVRDDTELTPDNFHKALESKGFPKGQQSSGSVALLEGIKIAFDCFVHALVYDKSSSPIDSMVTLSGIELRHIDTMPHIGKPPPSPQAIVQRTFGGVDPRDPRPTREQVLVDINHLYVDGFRDPLPIPLYLLPRAASMTLKREPPSLWCGDASVNELKIFLKSRLYMSMPALKAELLDCVERKLKLEATFKNADPAYVPEIQDPAGNCLVSLLINTGRVVMPPTTQYDGGLVPPSIDGPWRGVGDGLEEAAPFVEKSFMNALFVSADRVSSRTMDKAESQLNSFSFIPGLAVCVAGNLCWIRGGVFPSMKSDRYDSYVCVELDGNLVVVRLVKAICACTIRNEHRCHHIAALLLVVHYIKYPPVLPLRCTQLARTWSRGKRSDDDRLLRKDIAFMPMIDRRYNAVAEPGSQAVSKRVLRRSVDPSARLRFNPIKPSYRDWQPSGKQMAALLKLNPQWQKSGMFACYGKSWGVPLPPPLIGPLAKTRKRPSRADNPVEAKVQDIPAPDDAGSAPVLQPPASAQLQMGLSLGGELPIVKPPSRKRAKLRANLLDVRGKKQAERVALQAAIHGKKNVVTNLKAAHSRAFANAKTQQLGGYCYCRQHFVLSYPECPSDITMYQCKGVSGRGSSDWKCPARGWVCGHWIENFTSSSCPGTNESFVCFMCKKATVLLQEVASLKEQLAQLKEQLKKK
jgi:hypothetical protein